MMGSGVGTLALGDSRGRGIQRPVGQVGEEVPPRSVGLKIGRDRGGEVSGLLTPVSADLSFVGSSTVCACSASSTSSSLVSSGAIKAIDSGCDGSKKSLNLLNLGHQGGMGRLGNAVLVEMGGEDGDDRRVATDICRGELVSIIRWVCSTYHHVTPMLCADPGTTPSPERRTFRNSRNSWRTTAQMICQDSAGIISLALPEYSVHMALIMLRSLVAKSQERLRSLVVIAAPTGCE